LLLDKLTVPQPATKLLPFYGSRSFTIYPQEPAACPYPELYQSSPRPSLHVANGVRSDLSKSQAVQIHFTTS